jgi:hypothetical protein
VSQMATDMVLESDPFLICDFSPGLLHALHVFIPSV